MVRTNDDSATSSDSGIDELNPNGWEDVEEDLVIESFKSLFDEERFDSIIAMFDQCKAKYNFDIWSLQSQHDLDFLQLVRLVNYVRRSVSQGHLSPDVSSKSLFEDDVYLLPVLESDAVLYNLEEVLSQSRPVEKSRVEELEEELSALQARFDAYRNDVSKYLQDKLEQPDGPSSQQISRTRRTDEIDADYFHSYSFNAIHETMLKDQVRTDAYRDFIYDNKHIFADKVVLDIGCGTGILSLFCARAGAQRVIAVDNSNIIDAAREIIHTNGMQDKIECIRGKIEEVKLPVEKVDIIVSEWMGYGLLFESMLDSVIHARNKYLKPDGLMVPSHATIRLGAVADSDLRESHIMHWDDVYGFNMSAMASRTRSECVIKVIDASDLSGPATLAKVLDLHRVEVGELDFQEAITINPDVRSQVLDGFAVWFDIFFYPNSQVVSHSFELEAARKAGATAFTTGPIGQATHWQQAICFLEQCEDISGGKVIEGSVRLEKDKRDTRALEINFRWSIAGSKTRQQSWYVE